MFSHVTRHMSHSNAIWMPRHTPPQDRQAPPRERITATGGTSHIMQEYLKHWDSPKNSAPKTQKGHAAQWFSHDF